MMIKVLKVKSKIDVKRFREFWDEQKEHYSDPEQSRKNFFSIPSYVVFMEERTDLVGMLFVYIREITYQEQDIRFGGIGAVATHRDYRRKGVATKLLRRAFEIMQSEETDISLLSTNIEKYGKLYRSVGFVTLKRPYYFQDINGKIIEDDGCMIAPVNSPELVNKILDSEEDLFVGKSNF